MALNRRLLQGMNLNEEQIETIIAEHTATTSGLKDKLDELNREIDALKEKEGSAEKLQKELDKLKDEAKKDDWKGKYEKEHQDFEDYKKDVAGKETTAKIKAAYRKLLTDSKVGEKHLDAVLKVTDFSGMKLTDDGTLDNADELKKAIEKEWSGFITTTSKRSSENPENPPAGGEGGRTTGEAGKIARQYYEERYGKIKEGE